MQPSVKAENLPHINTSANCSSWCHLSVTLDPKDIYVGFGFVSVIISVKLFTKIPNVSSWQHSGFFTIWSGEWEHSKHLKHALSVLMLHTFKKFIYARALEATFPSWSPQLHKANIDHPRRPPFNHYAKNEWRENSRSSYSSSLSWRACTEHAINTGFWV